MNGTLYIVSTPIGNREDITLRAVRILKAVDVIAAEDTRHSLKLLTYYAISKPLISYWKEREKTRSEEILKLLCSGKSVALISDAGTPGISDPGTVLIQKAILSEIPVVPIPGPSALIAALSISGVRTDTFTFAGFLPSKKSQRQKVLKDLSLEPRTLIFYEAPHRVINTLKDMEGLFPGRKAVVSKEITKIHEQIIRGSIMDILGTLQKTKIAGEYIIIVEGRPEKTNYSEDDLLFEVHALIKKGLRRKDAVKRIAVTYGLSTKELYNKSLRETP